MHYLTLILFIIYVEICHGFYLTRNEINLLRREASDTGFTLTQFDEIIGNYDAELRKLENVTDPVERNSILDHLNNAYKTVSGIISGHRDRDAEAQRNRRTTERGIELAIQSQSKRKLTDSSVQPRLLIVDQISQGYLKKAQEHNLCAEGLRFF